jgi:hypothetical protein
MAAKQSGSVLSMLAWFTGIVVSLAVGFGLTTGILTLPNWLGGASNTGLFITQAVGWIVIVTTLISGALALLNK